MKLLLWTPAICMCRLAISEAEGFPKGSASFYDAIFTTARERLASFLRERLTLAPKASAEAADDLIGRIAHPRLTRALFGMDKVPDDWLDEDKISADFDLKPIRKAVAMLLNHADHQGDRNQSRATSDGSRPLRTTWPLVARPAPSSHAPAVPRGPRAVLECALASARRMAPSRDSLRLAGR